MYTGQPEKYVGTVFAFGEKNPLNASNSQVLRGFLTAPGGTTTLVTPTGTAVEFAVVIPRDGVLKNLYWSVEASTLAATGNRIIIYVKDPPTAAASAPTGLTVSWNGNVKSGFNITNTVPVVAGDTVSVLLQLARGSGTLTRPRVTIELEVDNLQYPNPWDLTGPVVSYTGGSVGIGTTSPAGELHIKNAVAGGIAGIFETTATGKILSGRVSASEKFSVDAGGNVYTSGKIGVGNTTPSTELDVNGTVQMQGMKLPTGASNGFVLTSDASGIGTWQPTGGGTVGIDGSGTVNAIPKFFGATTLDDSVIFENGGNIGIGTATPSTTLEVNGAISGFGIVPIGSVIAWHKSLTGTPSLPDGWVECNGQTLSDADSPYNGQLMPNLNGEGRFLRGAAISGTNQADEYKVHSHTMGTGGADSFTMAPGGVTQRLSHFVEDGYNGGGPKSTHGAGGTETRPINMSVVWIMRVK